MIPQLDRILGDAARSLDALGYQPIDIDRRNRQLDIEVAGAGVLSLTLVNLEILVTRGDPIVHIPSASHTPAEQSSDRGPRENAVPCRVIGCPARTFNWQALCGRHLSDEPTAPRRLTAVDPPSAGDVDDAPTGHRPPAGRGHPRTA